MKLYTEAFKRNNAAGHHETIISFIYIFIHHNKC